MVRTLFFGCAVVSGALLLAGCPKKTDDAADAAAVDAAPAPVDAAPAAAAAPPAKNVGEVARFPAEKPLADDAEKTVDLFAQARTSCKAGNNVALVRAGTDPFKVAEFQDCVLVTFPDPKDAATFLMGWIPKAAFTLDAVKDAGLKDAQADAAKDAAPDAAPDAALAGRCPAGQEEVTLGAGGVCRKKCTTPKDCKSGAAGSCLPVRTTAGKTMTVCANEAP
ncbi:MAG: hypothetical protein JWP97_721 [Labilithrix sp.]|nr:hypothetical protein [Labilithrix sp.]